MLNILVFTTLFAAAISVSVPINYHYQSQVHKQPNTQLTNSYYSSYHRPSYNQYASQSVYNSPSNRPTSSSGKRKVKKISKYSNSQFNRLPIEYQPTNDFEDGDEEDGEDYQGGQGVSTYPSQGGTSHLPIKKPQYVNCVPYKPFGIGLGLLNPFSGLLRSNDIENFDDPRTIIKLQFNDFNYGSGSIYKPWGGYPCRPYYRPGLLGGGGGLLGGLLGGGGGLYSDEGVGGTSGNRPGALGIFADTVKPIFASTALQDGIGATIGQWQPGQGIANILSAVGGITGQFATAPLAAVADVASDVRDVNKSFMELLFK